VQTAFWLALVSGIAHASWNALAKSPGRERSRKGERLNRRQWVGVLVLFGGVAVFGVEQLLSAH
jgi:hypothetical protein